VRFRRHRIPFEISASGCVNYMDECICLTEVVEEFVAQTPALMRLWDETSDIEQLDRDEARARLTRRILGLASMTELFVGARLPHKGDTSVRLDCREGIVGDLDWGESGSGEKGRLANIRFPDDPQLHGSTNVIPPQVP